MKTIRHISAGLGVMLLAACASAPTGFGHDTAVTANINAHRFATDALPVSAERMTLAIRRYNENDSEPPVKMHTTDAVSEE